MFFQNILSGQKELRVGYINMEYILSLIKSETEAILKIRKQESPNEFDSIQKNYIQSSKITSNWIKNYTELNFRSLGSYSKQQLLEMYSYLDLEEVGLGWLYRNSSCVMSFLYEPNISSELSPTKSN